MKLSKADAATIALLNALVPFSRAFHFTGQDRLQGTEHTWERDEAANLARIKTALTAKGIVIATTEAKPTKQQA